MQTAADDDCEYKRESCEVREHGERREQVRTKIQSPEN